MDIDRKSSIEDLRILIKTLRSEVGCPWDRKQTPRTIKAYVLEEAYEVVFHHRQLFFIRGGGTYPHLTVELPRVA